MLKVKPPKYIFCPFCGTKLTSRKDISNENRKTCPSCNWVYYPNVSGAAGSIIRNGNRVLMVKRVRSPHKNTWMFPAGFINFGEHPEETVIREIKEETGLDATSPKLIAVLQSKDDPRAPGHFVFFYQVKVTGKIQNLDPTENDNIEWFEIENPPKIGWKTHKHILKMLQKGIN